jgi:hypothetical protein
MWEVVRRVVRMVGVRVERLQSRMPLKRFCRRAEEAAQAGIVHRRLPCAGSGRHAHEVRDQVQSGTRLVPRPGARGDRGGGKRASVAQQWSRRSDNRPGVTRIGGGAAGCCASATHTADARMMGPRTPRAVRSRTGVGVVAVVDAVSPSGGPTGSPPRASHAGAGTHRDPGTGVLCAEGTTCVVST